MAAAEAPEPSFHCSRESKPATTFQKLLWLSWGGPSFEFHLRADDRHVFHIHRSLDPDWRTVAAGSEWGQECRATCQRYLERSPACDAQIYRRCTSRRTDEVGDLLEDVGSRYAPFRFTIEGIDAFPRVKRASVIRVGMSGEPLIEIANEIDHVRAGFGYRKRGVRSTRTPRRPVSASIAARALHFQSDCMK